MQFMQRLIAVPMGSLLYMLYNIFDNYAITLIVFTVIVRMLMFPLTIYQMNSSVRMQEMQPKLQALQKKYAKDPDTLNIKMQELYKEEKFSPFSGCLPLLIQFPIIIGLFALLRNPTLYIENTEMLMAVHESFLWIRDLSQPDPWVLPMLAGIATFFSTGMTQSQATTDNSAGGMMKGMKYFFPLMIFVMGRSFPAGLAMYWCIGTCVQIVQTFFTNRWKKRKLKNKKGVEKKTKK